MSSTSLILFKDGKQASQIEYRNSWGGAARIWDSLYNRHLKNPANQYDSWMIPKGNSEKLWKLVEREDLPVFERAVLAFTFDLFYVQRDNFRQFAKDLRQFNASYPVTGCVDHLLAWADVFEDQDCEAIGLYATSVGENQWCQPDPENEDGEWIKVPLTEGHEVYETYFHAVNNPSA